MTAEESSRALRTAVRESKNRYRDKKERLVMLSARVLPEDAAWIDTIARATGRDKSDIVRTGIHMFVTAYRQNPLVI